MKITRDEAQGFLDGRYHLVTGRTTERLLDLLSPASREYVRANMRTHQVRSGKIPTEAVLPATLEAVAHAGGILPLSRLVGIDQRRLHAVIHAREQEVGLPVLDRLLTRSLGALRFQEPDLRRWYYGDRVLS